MNLKVFRLHIVNVITFSWHVEIEFSTCWIWISVFLYAPILIHGRIALITISYVLDLVEAASPKGLKRIHSPI